MLEIDLDLSWSRLLTSGTKEFLPLELSSSHLG